MKRFCCQCGRQYEAWRKDAMYCSSTCRSRAFRATHPKPIRTSDQRRKMRETKLQMVELVKCCQCNVTWLGTPYNRHKMYCSRACQQRAYRERLAVKEQQRQRRVEVNRQRQGVMRLIGALQSAAK